MTADRSCGRLERTHNRDVAWERFDTGGYVADNYATVHPLDRDIIAALSPHYAAIPAGSLASSLDVGTGPNLYPLMLVAAASRRLEAVDCSTPNLRYLQRVCEKGPGPGWQHFWALCREHNPALPDDVDDVLRRVEVRRGDAFALPSRRHDLVSMFFVAESVTGVAAEFEQLCRSFADAAVPGGHLVAAFMAGMPSYELGGECLPSYPVDEGAIRAALRGHADDLRLRRLPADPTLPYEHDGVLLLTARAPLG